MQVAPHEDAAGNGVQGQQQQNKRYVFAHHGMRDEVDAFDKAENERERNQEQQRPTGGDFAEMVVPCVGKEQRARGDGQQNQGEGKAPNQA